MWFTKQHCFSLIIAISVIISWQIYLETRDFQPKLKKNQIKNEESETILLKIEEIEASLPKDEESIAAQCEEATTVVFLKTHKTAGSSIQNMLMRFGIKRNLKFLIPKSGNYFGHPQNFKIKMIKQHLQDNLNYDILTHHTRYDRSEISKVMSKNAHYITILRDPVTLFESAYSFCKLEKEWKMTIEEYVRPDVSDAIVSRNKRGVNGKIGRNQMMFDLGFQVKDFEEDQKIADFIQRLEADFHLVMITERLPESLILMKDVLCWSMDAIVIFHHNSRKAEYKKKITPELKNGILRWNRADKYLYDHFNMILDEKILKYGKEKMTRDLSELESVTKKWYDYCVESTADKSQLKGANKVWSPQVLGFKLKNKSNSTCADITKEEIPFTEEIQQYMKKYYKK